MNTTQIETNPELTIIIPAKNEKKLIPLLLNSLAQQDYPHMRSTKVYIADAKSTDGTPEIVMSFRDRLNVEVIPGGMPSVGRNAGARKAQSQYVLFIDADIELGDTRLIRRAVSLMKRRRLHCLTTNIWCTGGKFIDNVVYAGNNFFQYLSSLARPFSTGMFMMFDRIRFETLGGFNERAVFAEDYLLSSKVVPWRFRVITGGIYTTNRRFQKMGYLRMIWLFFWTLLNTFNQKHYQRDHNYWKEEAPVEQSA